ncbi:MAG: hypothetical protein L6422_08310 [Candidatus Marinimicrobia bacterium]|nr:hypothetical protein [bacterium]MCG2716270.1 hypothetical protein [Candidatus Neomarinimicrobiota bacterium]
MSVFLAQFKSIIKDLKFDLPRKEFTWFPADTQQGLHTIEAEFIWGAKRDVQTFTVYVNDKPEITTTCPQRDIIQIGETFKLNVHVKDSNDNAFLGYKLIDYPEECISTPMKNWSGNHHLIRKTGLIL